MTTVHVDPDQELRFNQAKAFLMQADAEGQSVYDHLHSIVATMLEENPGDVAHHPERFAELSSKLKKHAFVGAAASSSAANSAPSLHWTQVERAEANKKLFENPPPEVKTVVEQPTPFTTITTTTVVPRKAPTFKSVVSENVYWKHAGVGLSDTEAFLLDQSITKLASDKDLTEVRFVGKIFGLSGNYFVVSSKRYVAQGEVVYEEVNTMGKPPRKKVEVAIQSEGPFKGCNRLSFWVTSSPSAPWVLLPDITPEQLNAARKISKFFSGNLEASINAYPTFPWKERVYLRAQLSRLVSATYIAPNSFLEKVEPEEDEEEETEEGAKKGPKPAKYFPLTRVSKEPEEMTIQGLADPENWVHGEGYIYETGRQTKVPPKPETEEEEEQPPEDEEEEEEKKEEEEKDLFLPIKKDASYAIINIPKEPNPDEEDEAAEEEPPAEEGEGEEKEEKEEDEEEIPDDDPLRKKIPAWGVRLTNTLYKNHSVAIVRSLRWPGAVAYAAQKGKQWGSVYFGFGFKKTDHAFAPVPSIDILKEAEDVVETADPTAANEKLVLRGEEPKEADSEDEKDEDEEQEEA